MTIANRTATGAVPAIAMPKGVIRNAFGTGPIGTILQERLKKPMARSGQSAFGRQRKFGLMPNYQDISSGNARAFWKSTKVGAKCRRSTEVQRQGDSCPSIHEKASKYDKRHSPKMNGILPPRIAEPDGLAPVVWQGKFSRRSKTHRFAAAMRDRPMPQTRPPDHAHALRK